MTEQLAFAEIEPAPRPKHRLFFALRPTVAAVESIEQLLRRLRAAHRLAGRRIDAERLHVTLFHVGDFIEMPHGVVDAAGRAAATIAVPAIDLAFDRVGSFRGQSGKLPFVLLGDEGVAGAIGFRQTLVNALAKVGIAHRAKASFTPHVTLMYADHEVPAEAIEPIGWAAHEFVLVHSLIGEGRHNVLRRWPLAG